jgi:putative acetyltransferase
VQIQLEAPAREDVYELLGEHLKDMHAQSPAESVHALDTEALSAPGITLWSVRDAGILLGCGALKELAPDAGEIKSMRTATAVRGRGVGARMLVHLMETARRRGYVRLSLETGTEDFFAPAHRLYKRHGFRECPPFGDYRPDPHSLFMALDLHV